ncbi:MAG: sulfotransferase [Deltaproteobacteria bacterium]|nr:sulfotransferase [Deltaproteobacteria bacterium]
MAQQSCSAEDFIGRFMTEYAVISGKKRWVEKTPANVLHLERIFSFWPKAYFVYVVRDPRDVYSSVCRAGKWTEPDIFAKLWIKFINAYEKAKKVVPPRSIMEVKYEELVLEPEKTMRDVLDFVGESWEKGVARFLGEPKDFERVRKFTGKSSTTLEQLSRPLVKNRIGAWRNELENEKDLLKLEEIIKNMGFYDTWVAYQYSISFL